MLQGWLLEPSARFSFVDGSSMAVRRCHGVTGLNGCWLSIRVCALSWRKRLTKDQSMIAPPCDLCSMKWFQSTPLEPLWPMTSISSCHFILDFHFMPEAFQQCQPSSKLTPLQRFMKWSVSDRRNRTISPFSQLTISEWLENRIKEGTVEGLRSALQVDPANARVAAHLGRCLADQALAQGSDPDEARR